MDTVSQFADAVHKEFSTKIQGFSAHVTSEPVQCIDNCMQYYTNWLATGYIPTVSTNFLVRSLLHRKLAAHDFIASLPDENFTVNVVRNIRDAWQYC